jgi:NAD(P)-dependent dehydrogenase (short-subunit alcohol dehydrogenase family)
MLVNNEGIMNVTSGLAFVPLPATPTYNAAKAALHSFSESLRVQLADTSVQVIEVAPPGVRMTLLGHIMDDHESDRLGECLTEDAIWDGSVFGFDPVAGLDAITSLMDELRRTAGGWRVSRRIIHVN